MIPNRISKSLGFTLIELLVVIAVIGFLATMALVALNNSRIKARDARRIADIKQLQKALEMYYNQNNAYPISGSCDSACPNNSWCNSIQSMSGGHWVRNGAANLAAFMSQDPVDPKPLSTPNWGPGCGSGSGSAGGGVYYYFANSYGGSGQWYMIVFGLEDRLNSYQNLDGVTACDGTKFHYGSGSDGVITLGANCATK